MFNFFKRKSQTEKSEINEEPKSSTFLIRYSYEWLDEIPFTERTPCNEFCKTLMKLDKFYSRSDIESMSLSLGYSVWDRRGGWIDKWDKDENGNPIEHHYIKDGIEHLHCKHQWKSNIVKKESK